ncbi:hypothetical protein BaRGS_00002080 [Batillaria attramentaria]|uniref:Uncharacterized protein n=1 Tax=Batillaria attramentaria TaxID=370345 RepID=A0ABD0M4L5_9CAEN
MTGKCLPGPKRTNADCSDNRLKRETGTEIINVFTRSYSDRPTRKSRHVVCAGTRMILEVKKSTQQSRLGDAIHEYNLGRWSGRVTASAQVNQENRCLSCQQSTTRKTNNPGLRHRQSSKPTDLRIKDSTGLAASES